MILPSSILPWQISRKSELDEDKKEHILLSNDKNMYLPSCHYNSVNLHSFSSLYFFSSCVKDIPVIISTPSSLRQIWLPYTQEEESSLITNTYDFLTLHQGQIVILSLNLYETHNMHWCWGIYWKIRSPYQKVKKRTRKGKDINWIA